MTQRGSYTERRQTGGGNLCVGSAKETNTPGVLVVADSEPDFQAFSQQTKHVHQCTYHFKISKSPSPVCIYAVLFFTGSMCHLRTTPQSMLTYVAGFGIHASPIPPTTPSHRPESDSCTFPPVLGTFFVLNAEAHLVTRTAMCTFFLHVSTSDRSSGRAGALCTKTWIS